MRSTQTGLLNKKRKGNYNNPQGTEIIIGEKPDAGASVDSGWWWRIHQLCIRVSSGAS